MARDYKAFSWLQKKKTDNNLQRIANCSHFKKLPRVLQRARACAINTAQSLFPHLLPGLINGYTVTANRLLIPYARQKNRQSSTNQNLMEATRRGEQLLSSLSWSVITLYIIDLLNWGLWVLIFLPGARTVAALKVIDAAMGLDQWDYQYAGIAIIRASIFCCSHLSKGGWGYSSGAPGAITVADCPHCSAEILTS